ncbi:TM2 domain-containing protein [Nibrella saemangeumensis]
MTQDFLMIPGLQPEEMMMLQGATKDMTENQQRQLVMLYQSKRRDPTLTLILALLGFVGVAGVHRFVLGHIWMGLLYFFTGGLLLIGTIVDLINHKRITNKYNREKLFECVHMVRMAR